MLLVLASCRSGYVVLRYSHSKCHATRGRGQGVCAPATVRARGHATRGRGRGVAAPATVWGRARIITHA